MFSQTLTLFLSVLLGIQPYALAKAKTNATQLAPASLSLEQKFAEVAKANPKTLGEFWKVVEPHMDRRLHQLYAHFLSPYFQMKMPKMKLSGDKLLIKHKKGILAIDTRDLANGVIKVNRKLIWHDFVADPKALKGEMQKALEERQVSLFELLFLPKAHALSWIWVIMIALGAWLLSAWFSPTDAYKAVKSIF